MLLLGISSSEEELPALSGLLGRDGDLEVGTLPLNGLEAEDFPILRDLRGLFTPLGVHMGVDFAESVGVVGVAVGTLPLHGLEAEDFPDLRASVGVLGIAEAVDVVGVAEAVDVVGVAEAVVSTVNSVSISSSDVEFPIPEGTSTNIWSPPSTISSNIEMSGQVETLSERKD